jgi:hypothetical protein
MGAPRRLVVGTLLACAAATGACGGDDVVTIVVDGPDAPPPDAPIDAGPDATPSTEVIFTQDFNALSNGANLVGSAGWTGSGQVPVNLTVFGRGIAGRTAAAGALGFAAHTVAFADGDLYTVRFRGFASATKPASENTAFGAGTGSSLGAAWVYSSATNTWSMDVAFVSSLTIPETVAGDQNILFEIILDAAEWQVWGAYTIGGNRTETSHVQMMPPQFRMLTSVAVQQDYRNGQLGADYDDVLVFRTPGPL